MSERNEDQGILDNTQRFEVFKNIQFMRWISYIRKALMSGK
jgi:hypothetical protein